MKTVILSLQGVAGGIGVLTSLHWIWTTFFEPELREVGELRVLYGKREKLAGKKRNKVEAVIEEKAVVRDGMLGIDAQ